MANRNCLDIKHENVAVSLDNVNNKVDKTNETISYKEENKGDEPLSAVLYPTSYSETLFHLVKGNIGSGMFAMGDAFRNSGLLLGPLMTIVLSCICVYGNHVLARCSKELAHRRKLTRYPMYPETMEWAFETGPEPFRKYSKTIRLLVEVFLLLAQLGFCSIYFLYISSTLQKILGKYGVSLDVHVWMVVIFVPMVSTAMVRTLKFLVPFSVLANVLTIAAVFLTMFISMEDLPPVTSRPAFADFSRLPLAFGTVLFCFEGIGLVLPLQSEMRDPEKFGGRTGVLNAGMGFVSGLLVWIGFVGYLKYGDAVQGSLTHNLPKDSILSTAVQLTLAAGLLFSYALQFHVAAITVWPGVDRRWGPFRRPLLAELGVRLALATVTFAAAEAVPLLGLLISLLGSVGSTALVLVFPPLCDLALRSGGQGSPGGPGGPGPHLAFDALSVALAAAGFVAGSYCSLRDIAAALRS